VKAGATMSVTAAAVGLPAAGRSPATLGLAAGLAAATLWGLYLALSRAGVVGGLTGLDIAVIRYGVAGLITLPLFAPRGWPLIRRIGWLRAVVLAALAGPPFVLAGVGGYAFAPLAHGALIQPATVTVGSLVLAALWLGDRPTRARLLGVGVILAGLAVVAGPGLFAGGAMTPLGDAMFLAAGLMWAVFAVLSKRWRVGPVEGTIVVSVLSGVVLVPLVAATAGFGRVLALPTGELAAQALVQGVLSGVVAVIAFATSVRWLGASRAAVFPALVPISATLIGIPVAGEWPTALQLAGLALVVAGLGLAVGVVRRTR
jgi:drug/metabolite transporter (DMT)-like permease